MKYIAILIFTFGTTILLSYGQGQSKENETAISTSSNNKLSDIERLLEKTMPFIEGYLSQHGQFLPLASAVQTNDSIAMSMTYDGNENPDPVKVIADLKKVFKTNKDDFKTIAIFYDATVLDPNTKVKTDAVAVFVETNGEDTAFIFYYPYSLPGNKQFSFSDGTWKIGTAKEIFKD